MARLFSMFVLCLVAASMTLLNESNALRLQTRLLYKQAFVDGYYRGLHGKDAVVKYTPVHHQGQVFYLPHALPSHAFRRQNYGNSLTNHLRLGALLHGRYGHVNGGEHSTTTSYANKYGHGNGQQYNTIGHANTYSHGNEQGYNTEGLGGYNSGAGYQNVGYSNHYG